MIFINNFRKQNHNIQIGNRILMYDNGLTAHDINDLEAAFTKRLAASRTSPKIVRRQLCEGVTQFINW